jgi:hypothetical protein
VPQLGLEHREAGSRLHLGGGKGVPQGMRGNPVGQATLCQ